MDIVFKFFDQITDKIPPRILQLVRLSALLIWLVLATIAIFFSWQRGAMEAPQSGQDLSMAAIREKITRQENLQKPPDIVIPQINELPTERRFSDLPYEARQREGRGLAGEDDRLREPYPQQDSMERAPENMPPYLGDTGSPNTDQVFPRNTYKPARDPGVGGVRERPAPGQEIPVFDLDGPGATPSPTQQLRRDPPPRSAPETDGNSPAPGAGAGQERPAPGTAGPASSQPRSRAQAPPASPSGSGAGLDLLPVD